MKKIIFILVIFSANLHAEYIDKKIIDKRYEKIRERIQEKIKIFQIDDDEFLRLEGYSESLEFVISIID